MIWKMYLHFWRHDMGNLAVLLTVVFVTLKLIGQLDWHWIYVFMPILVYILLAVITMSLAFVGLCTAKKSNKYFYRNKIR